LIIWAKTASNPTFDDVDDVSMLFRARLISTALPTTAGTGRARLKNRIHRGAVVQRQLCLVATMDVKTLAGYTLFTCGHMTIITIASQHNSWSCCFRCVPNVVVSSTAKCSRLGCLPFIGSQLCFPSHRIFKVIPRAFVPRGSVLRLRCDVPLIALRSSSYQA